METPREIQIQPLGSYFDIDAEGYLINPASKDAVQEEYKPLINDIVGAYEKNYGERLRYVYMRGSVARGQAIAGVSDIDTFAYVDILKDDIDEHWTKEAEEDFRKKYPFINGVEMNAYPLSAITQDTIILNQSIVVWGEEIVVPKLKIGKDLARHAPNFHKRIQWFSKFLQKEVSDEEIETYCVWFMKGMLRIGCEITMERSQKYTRDLYKCYEVFSEFYPEKEAEMREVLYLALNPIHDKHKIQKIVDTLGVWLVGEINNVFPL